VILEQQRTYVTSEADREYRRAWYQRNKERMREYNKQYRRDDRAIHFVRTMLIQAKDRAKRKGMPFDITVDDLIVPTHCPYLGVELLLKSSYRGNPRRDNLATIDRIDNTKGYTKGNVQIISHLANMMKNHATMEQLTTFAKAILAKTNRDLS
jgi:hypothetical protein